MPAEPEERTQTVSPQPQYPPAVIRHCNLTLHLCRLTLMVLQAGRGVKAVDASDGPETALVACCGT